MYSCSLFCIKAGLISYLEYMTKLILRCLCRFEHLYDESRLFIEFLNKSTELVPRWDNPSDIASSTNSVACTYYGQLTVEQITPLLSKYAHDFLMYEYSADEYVKCAKDYKPGVKVVVQPSRHFSNQEPLVDAVR